VASNAISTVRMEELRRKQRKIPIAHINALQYMQSPRSAFIFGILLFAIRISAALDDLVWSRSLINVLVV
jgi:hypothetical protein